MKELEIGVRVVVTDARTLGAVGIAHVPGPVRPDDLIAFGEGHPWRVLALLPTAPGATVRVLADQVALSIAARERGRGSFKCRSSSPPPRRVAPCRSLI